jgi:hypothetical protein
MKLTNVVLVSCAALLASLGTPGCAENGELEGDPASTTQELERAASWEKLGETRVEGDYDRDVITVGQDDGRFSSIQIRVENSSLVMFGIRVVFGNGEVFEPNVRFVFDEHTRSRVIDLPGNLRFIKRVEFRYGNIPGGGNAKVQLFGRNVTPPPDWQNLGERRVDGSHDHDTIVVGGGEGPFSAIQVRVKRSALVMHDIKVTFGNGEVFSPNVRLVFDENTRSRIIDLPGARRNIKRVDFRYTDLPHGGDAAVQLWATL